MVQLKHESPTQRRSSLKRFSPRKDDSPSRQLNFELEQAMEKLQIHDYERRKVHAYNRKSYHEELDAKDFALAKAHMEALEAASAKHEAVRQEAEAVLQRHLKEQEEKLRREQEEERLRQQREAREKAERERKAREEAEHKIRLERERKEAEAKKAAEEKAKAEAAQAAEVAETQRKQQEDMLRKEQKEKADREAAIKAKTEKEAIEKQKSQQAATAAAAKLPAPAPLQQGFYAASPEADTQHKEYLALHQKLKTFRKDFWEQTKQNKSLKAVVGDMRRAMRTSVGQLTDDREGNKKASQRIKSAIQQAVKDIPSPEISVSDFLPTHLSLNDQSTTKIRSLVIYLISILSKAIINAFTGECAVNTKAAESIGTLTAQIFALPELQFQRQSTKDTISLMPILLAKYHKVAPILFGISGPESTAQGRLRLGWRLEPSGNESSKAFVMDQRHHERMTGLGAGFASIALRNFSKTRLNNPFPPSNFWTALAGIVNTPPADVQTSHLLLLKSMLENNAMDRFVLFYGNLGVGALRDALIDFPQKLPNIMKTTPASRSLELMVDAMAQDKHFRLS